MDKDHTRNWQRIIIWVITIAMAFGSIGFYFLIIMQRNNQDQSLQNSTAVTQESGNVDPTAYTTQDAITQLQITDLKTGTGAEVKAGDTITVHYKGTFAKSGKKFDSSYDRGEPVTFALSGVIQGWQDGVPGMKVGGKRRLVVPANLAYGSSGTNGIPPNSDLVFEVELLSIEPPVTNGGE